MEGCLNMEYLFCFIILSFKDGSEDHFLVRRSTLVPSSRPTPISVSLMAKVIKIGHVAKFKTSNGEEAEMINFSLADKSGAILATCTDTSKDRMIKEGKTLHIREFILKNGRVAMSHKTKVLAKPNMDIPVDILQKAEHLILPPSPIKKVEEILASPLRSITTVQGQLSKVELKLQITWQSTHSNSCTIDSLSVFKL